MGHLNSIFSLNSPLPGDVTQSQLQGLGCGHLWGAMILPTIIHRFMCIWDETMSQHLSVIYTTYNTCFLTPIFTMYTGASRPAKISEMDAHTISGCKWSRRQNPPTIHTHIIFLLFKEEWWSFLLFPAPLPSEMATLRKKKQSKKHRRLSAAQRVPGRMSPGYRMLDEWG